jgi:Flp pilus assembly pilin Flp
MKLLKKIEWVFRKPKGQTMAEYALLLASVAVIVFGGYQRMGTTITAVLTNVDGKL